MLLSPNHTTRAHLHATSTGTPGAPTGSPRGYAIPGVEGNRGGLSRDYSSGLGLSKCHTSTRVEIAEGGELLTLRGVHHGKIPRAGRGRITQFSAGSRRRMFRFFQGLDRRQLPPLKVFITLTYPKAWSRDGRIWKAHYKTFRQRLQRHMGANLQGGVYKLEPQQRGAPHFHILAFASSIIDKKWVAQTWYEVVNSQDINHLYAGTRVEGIRSWKGIKSYASKNYMGKEIGELPEEWQNIGRLWGVFGDLPTKITSQDLGPGAYYRLRRVCRAYAKRVQSYEVRFRSRMGRTFYIPAASGRRMVAWATGLDTKFTGVYAEPHEQQDNRHRNTGIRRGDREARQPGRQVRGVSGPGDDSNDAGRDGPSRKDSRFAVHSIAIEGRGACLDGQ